jgi:hypothetical protein
VFSSLAESAGTNYQIDLMQLGQDVRGKKTLKSGAMLKKINPRYARELGKESPSKANDIEH